MPGLPLVTPDISDSVRSSILILERDTLYRAYQQNPEAVQRWLEEEYPAIRRQAELEGALIYFGDEAAMRSDFHRGTSWAPVGQTPVVKATGDRFSLNLISAISGQGLMRFMTVEGKLNGEKFVEFLRRLLHNSRRPIFRRRFLAIAAFQGFVFLTHNLLVWTKAVLFAGTRLVAVHICEMVEKIISVPAFLVRHRGGLRLELPTVGVHAMELREALSPTAVQLPLPYSRL